MSLYTLGTLSPDLEALRLLEHFYGCYRAKENDDYLASVHRYAALGVLTPDEEVLLQKAYRAVEALALPEAQLRPLFGPTSPIRPFESAASLYFMLEPLRDHPQRDTLELKTILSFLDLTVDAPASKEGLLQLIGEMELPLSVKWLCVEALFRLDAHLPQVHAYLDQVKEALLPLAPFFHAWEARWRKHMTPLCQDDTFTQMLLEHGVNINEPMVLQPIAISFGSLSIRSISTLPGQTLTAECGLCAALLMRMEQNEKDSLTDLLRVLHTLDDKSRLSILHVLARKTCNGRELAEQTGLSPSTISHHLNELCLSGLVTIEKQGVSVFCHSRPEGVRELLRMLEKELL